MALADIVADIHTQLALIDPAFALAQPLPLLGKEYLSENAAPPRVVWVALRASPGIQDQRGLAPRSFFSRRLSVACHVWGKDTASAETLLNEVHNAARRSFASGARWTSEEWPDQTDTDPARAGTLVVVVFEFKVPITEIGQLSVIVTDPAKLTQTIEIAFPNSTVSGTPAP